MTLSIVMPTYNDAQYLPTAIEAILAQSFPDFELIIVNDGSLDNSEALIRHYAEKDKRILSLTLETNQGVVRAANKGCALAKGLYLYFASSDDYILPGFFEALMKPLLAHPHASLAVSDFGFFYDEKNPQCQKLLPGCVETKLFNRSETLQLFQSSYFWIPCNTSIFKRQEAAKRGFLTEELGYSCDHVLVHAIAFKEGLIYVPKMLTLMRLLPPEKSRVRPHKNGDRLVSYLKKHQELWRDFYGSTLLARHINSRHFALFLHPKHWDIVLPLYQMKIKLLMRKLLRIKHFIF